uniref:Kappa-scoloptoxin(03)-Ssm1d n=1 Tax=Scolopendra mutilans TaxID=2836329 RepID=TX31D_SCOMU|nr:RecName: Full=Kappa-scoloptoxin(03)-Ssm1d; Short=Kappa-SLPTX(03)-Ssm1d; AltName: Full=Kappa-scoloptoxin-Ssm1d; Short=Kappa-SLPTX-Ssm1d; Flags: Precursor [Scolopendra mutilans]AFM55018.1 putative K+ channel inhibitor 9 [Scolopendra subspinipes]
MKLSMAILLVMALIIFTLDKNYSSPKDLPSCEKGIHRKVTCKQCNKRSDNDDDYTKCCKSFDAFITCGFLLSKES